MSLERNVRKHGLKVLFLAAAVAFGLAINGFHQVDAAQPQQAQLVPASATLGQPSLAPKIPAPGTAMYETGRGDTVVSVARKYLAQTSYLTSSQLAEAIRGSNGDLKG